MARTGVAQAECSFLGVYIYNVLNTILTRLTHVDQQVQCSVDKAAVRTAIVLTQQHKYALPVLLFPSNAMGACSQRALNNLAQKE